MSKRSRAKRAARHGRQVGIVGRSASTADTAPHAPTAAQVRAVKAKATQPRKRAADSDALTGEPRDKTALVLRVRDWDASRHLYRGQPIPSRIHGRAMDGGDDRRDDAAGSGATRRGGYGLGAPVFAHGFLHYIAPVLPESVRQRRARADEWWTVPGVAGPLIRRFGLNAVTAAGAVERGADVLAVARQMHVTPTQIRMWQKRIRGEFARMQRGQRESARQELSPAS